MQIKGDLFSIITAFGVTFYAFRRHIVARKTKTVWSAEWGNPIHFCHGDRNARGVMICVSKSASCKVDVVEKMQQW